MKNDERLVKEVLTYLLEQMDKWNGEIDQMETLLEQCDQKLTALAQSTAGFRANENLAKRVILKYQELLLRMKTQKEEIAKEIPNLYHLIMNFTIEGEKRMYQAQAMQENYLKTQVMSASPNKLIEMLLEGAIKKIRVAKLALETGKLAQMGENLLKAQDIVMELRYSINEEIESTIPQDLIQLYEYMYQRLVIANVDRDTEAMDEVQKLLTELLDAWKQISEVK